MRFSKKQPQGLLSTMNYALITYICAFLAVGPFVGGLSAKITPKRIEKEVGAITIKKGDTLWDLAIKYFKDPFLWKGFRKYNKFTNPHLIYPGEKLMIPVDIARQIEGEIIETMAATKADLEKITKKYDKTISEFQSASKDIGNIEKTLAKLRKENQALKNQLNQREKQLQEIIKQMKEQGTQSEKTREQIEKLESLLTSQQATGRSAQQEIKALEESLAERSKQLKTREEELSQLSKEIKDHTERLDTSQKNISELQEKIKEAEVVDFAKEAEKPADEKESKLAVATAIAGGLVLFIVGVLAR